MDVHDGSIRNLLNANNNLPGTIKAFIKSFVKPGALTFRSLRARALKSRDAETPTETPEGTETTETPEEPPKPTANEILFEYFPRYSVLIAYIQEILKKADLTLGDDESSVYLSFQFQIAELLRQICLMYDNISDFTRYDDDHDPEHGEEEVLQTSIKTGKVLTQSLIIDTKDGEVDVLQELKKNTSSGGGGRHELEINEIEEKLAEKADKEHKHNISDINELQATLNSKADKNELDATNKVLKSHKHNISDINELQTSLDNKADKNHVHYISSDEQIITDYHGYLTQGEKVNTKNVNERRYKFIRAKGYDIHCTVQYDTGIAPQSFGYNAEIYASYFFVNGVLVEPRFTLRVKSKITFEDAIKSKADKTELDATNKVLKSHKHNISDINELQTSLDSKADKNHTHKSFTTVRADDIILNYDLGSSAPLENPSTSVKDTLNSLDNSCRNIESHARNFEAYELPAMLDKKADKTYVDTELTKKFSKPDTMTFTTEIINGEPATPFEFVRGLQPDTFEFFLDNSIELTLHYKSGTNATFHPGDTFQMVFNDISSLEYVYRVMSIYDLIYPIGAVYT
ncbi:keratin-associated protein family, partial [Trichomonas vaginalis G3]|uniref:keratin-associated protein family n=1 Tax=Trichomonas vaginalis (strain ATCC PRA-98 / G3) TaxID=412133 RepID=UPI0021E5328B